MKMTVCARGTVALAALVLAALATIARTEPQALNAQLSQHIYLPLAFDRAEMPPPPVSQPRPTVGATATATEAMPGPTATEGATEPPTETRVPPTETPTDLPPSATPKPDTGSIIGQYVSRGEPISAGFGAPGVPQIELQRQDGGVWTKVANAETADEGRFAFVDPPALDAGQVYQVWWVNTSLTGYDEWVGRWSSRRIASFGDGTDVDLGTMELGNVALTGPGNDLHFSLPVTYKWTTRDGQEESYRWSLHAIPSCDETNREPPSLYRTSPLGHVGKYELSGPPSGFRMETLYCWYVFIDAGAQGTGWSFEGWKTKWLIAGLTGN